MSSARDSEKFHPRSPVQPGRSPAPYFVAALLAAIMIWTVTQYSMDDWRARLPFLGTSPMAHPPHAARGDVRAVFSADDYPAAALGAGDQGNVQARLTVDANGRVRRCTIVRSSGHASLDDATCSIFQRRARFTPAHDAHGRAVASFVVTPPVEWRLAE